MDEETAIMSSAEKDELLDKIMELEARVQKLEKPDNAFWTQLAFDVLILIIIAVWMIW